jgi:hypothetical protein
LQLRSHLFDLGGVLPLVLGNLLLQVSLPAFVKINFLEISPRHLLEILVIHAFEDKGEEIPLIAALHCDFDFCLVRVVQLDPRVRVPNYFVAH